MLGLAGHLTAGMWGRGGGTGLFPYYIVHNVGNLEKGPQSLFNWSCCKGGHCPSPSGPFEYEHSLASNLVMVPKVMVFGVYVLSHQRSDHSCTTAREGSPSLLSIPDVHSTFLPTQKPPTLQESFSFSRVQAINPCFPSTSFFPNKELGVRLGGGKGVAFRVSSETQRSC